MSIAFAEENHENLQDNISYGGSVHQYLMKVYIATIFTEECNQKSQDKSKGHMGMQC
jgi:hypothetical protein